MDLAYNLLMILAAVGGLPLFVYRFARERLFRERVRQNLGFFSPETLAKIEGRGPIWFQAASVGEVVATSPIIRELKRQLPEIPVLVSSGTISGYEMAQRIIPETDAVIFYPPDVPGLPGRILSRIKPRAYVPVETELWPNFIQAAQRSGIPVVLVNGRIGERNLDRYRQMRRLFTGMLDAVSHFCMQSAIDAAYITRLGADPSIVQVTGNTKYDQNGSQIDETAKAALRYELGFDGAGPILVAGSTHHGEEEMLADALRKIVLQFPAAKLLVAPRDILRSGKVVSLFQRHGFAAELRSKSETNSACPVSVVVLDTIGELGRVYSLADLVFVGGSLVDHGGHNILEPAAYGKPILVGPHMFNFKDTHALFSGRNACATVIDGPALMDKALELLHDNAQASRMGQEAAAIVMENRGAAGRTVHALRQILTEKEKRS